MQRRRVVNGVDASGGETGGATDDKRTVVRMCGIGMGDRFQIGI